MQEEKFLPEESLQLIQTMIDKVKNTVADRSFYFLLWGWLVFIASLLQFVLKVLVKSSNHGAAWNLMFIGIIVSIFRNVKGAKKRTVTTYVDDSLRYTWISIFITQLLFVFVFMRRGDWEYCYTFYMLLYAIGCFITGRIIKFSPLVWGAIGCWFLAIVSTFASFDYNILLSALAVLISYIIPGHLLRLNYRKRE
jgi:hypothetical protein